MTKQTKYILFGILGLGTIIGAIIILSVLVVGLIAIAASSEESPEKSGDSKTNRRGNSSKSISNDAAKIPGRLSPELVGLWKRSEGSGYRDYTGKTQYKSGADYMYEFSSDGRVKYSMKSDVLSILQCKIAETKDAVGQAANNDEDLTISFGTMTQTSSNSCEESENFKKTLPPEITRFKYNLKTEYEKIQLCIEEDKGEVCYDRES